MLAPVLALAWLPSPTPRLALPRAPRHAAPVALGGLDASSLMLAAYDLDAASRSLFSNLDIGESFRSVTTLEPAIEFRFAVTSWWFTSHYKQTWTYECLGTDRIRWPEVAGRDQWRKVTFTKE